MRGNWNGQAIEGVLSTQPPEIRRIAARMNAPLQLLRGHEKDIGGGFTVLRLLPAAQQRSVGPFVFFDHFGPTLCNGAREHDVRPHPHIGLANVTYLFQGAMMHHDSLGALQRIEPGAINWMTAGRGIRPACGR